MLKMAPRAPPCIQISHANARPARLIRMFYLGHVGDSMALSAVSNEKRGFLNISSYSSVEGTDGKKNLGRHRWQPTNGARPRVEGVNGRSPNSQTANGCDVDKKVSFPPN